MRHKPNVCTEVVANNLCIGCGVCVAVCPKGTLEMRFNLYGEYNAFETNIGCSEKCNLCLKVCPFYDNEDNEDSWGKRLFADIPGVKHTLETGYYLESHVGYSSKHREQGASGGLATWTLETLLENGHIDYAICVGQNDDPQKLFKFRICKTVDEICSCSKSCYYPVETSEVLQCVLANEGRYAIIGLPCVCKAVRLAQLKDPVLKARIKYVLGLVCGQTKSKFFAEYICALGGGDPHRLNKVVFRIKDKNRPASDFGMHFVCDSGVKREGTLYWSEGMGRVWCERFFTPNSCNYCDDTFAEVADAVFMDAWLSEYMNDPAGTSLLIVREPLLEKLLNKAILDKELQLNKIAIDMLIQSRQTVVNFKRKKMRQRLAFGLKRGQRLPLKRDKPASVLSVRELYLLSAMWRAMTWSKVAFLAQLESGPGLKTFHRIMLRHLWYDYLIKGIFRLVGRVNRSIRKFLKC